MIEQDSPRGQDAPKQDARPRPRDPTEFYAGDREGLLGRQMAGPEDMPSVSWGEAWSASRIMARGDRTDADDLRLREGYTPLLEALGMAASENPANYEDSQVRGTPLLRWSPTLRRMVGRVDMEVEIARRIAQRQASDPEFLKGVPAEVSALHEHFVAQVQGQRAGAAATLERARGIGGTIASFGGGTFEAMLDPVNVATLPVGGFGRTGATRVLTEGLANAGVEAITQPIVAQRRAEIGETLTPGEAAGNIAMAGIGGAAFQGAGEGVHALARRVIGPGRMTDAERGAANMIERDDEILASNPFGDGAGADAHLARVEGAMGDAAAGVAPRAAPALDAGGAGSGGAALKARIRSAESSGNDMAANSRSSAFGRYQFTAPTWLRYYRKRYGAQGLSEEAILAKRADPAVQEALMDDLVADNSAALARIGARPDAGNLYLMHFLGQGGATAVLRAAPDTPIERIVGEGVVAANPFLRGKHAGDVIAWAHDRMGSAPGGPTIRRDATGSDSEWLAAQREVDAAEAELTAARSGVIAGLDAAPEIAVPPAIDPAATVRGMDWMAGDTPVEAPRAARDAPRAGNDYVPPSVLPTRTRPSDVLEFLADRGGIRDDEGHSLTRSGTSSRTGRSVTSSRDYAKVFVPKAGPLVRVKRGMPIDTAGELLHEAGFFAERPTTAQVLDMIDNAVSGEKIYALQDRADMQARPGSATKWSEADTVFADTVGAELGILREGDPAMFDAVLARVADGQDRWSALEAEFELRGKEALDRLSIETGDSSYAWDPTIDASFDAAVAPGGGPAPGGSGRSGEPGDTGGSAEAGGNRRPDRIAQGQSALAQAAAVRAFDDPEGAAAKAQTDSIEHDLRMQADPNIAARQRQEVALKADAPMQSKVDPEGAIGMGLFDAADQPTFRLEAEGEEITLGALLEDLDAEDAAIEAARACL